MTNFEAVKRFDQSTAMIEKLFWIAGSLENEELKELLEYVDDDFYKKYLPEIYNSNILKECRKGDTIIQSLIDFRKFGLMAEVLFPKLDDFKYKNDIPVSWSIHTGACRIECIYVETLEELITSIEQLSNKIFNEYLEEDKKR